MSIGLQNESDPLNRYMTLIRYYALLSGLIKMRNYKKMILRGLRALVKEIINKHNTRI